MLPILSISMYTSIQRRYTYELQDREIEIEIMCTLHCVCSMKFILIPCALAFYTLQIIGTITTYFIILIQFDLALPRPVTSPNSIDCNQIITNFAANNNLSSD